MECLTKLDFCFVKQIKHCATEAAVLLESTWCHILSPDEYLNFRIDIHYPT